MPQVHTGVIAMARPGRWAATRRRFEPVDRLGQWVTWQAVERVLAG